MKTANSYFAVKNKKIFRWKRKSLF